MDKVRLTEKIKAKAVELGFRFVGIAPAGNLDDASAKLNEWLARKFNAGMEYMATQKDIRSEPEKLLPGVKSIIVCAHNYYSDTKSNDDSYKIARYAYGRDYHNILRKNMKKLQRYISEICDDIDSCICIDSAPIMEKVFAQKAGIGWNGKNGCLIIPKSGSFYFLAELLITTELVYDKPAFDHCGNCSKCIEACPTGAIVEPYVIDSNKCISYLTIEHKGELPEAMRGRYDNWIFGCDICQEACPFNRFAENHDEPAFEIKPEFIDMSKTDWENLTEDKFDRLFAGSPVKRTKYQGLMRNIEFLKTNSKNKE